MTRKVPIMGSTIVNDFMRELVGANPTAQKLPVECARDACRMFERYPSIDRTEALKFMELFTVPGQWLILNQLRGEPQAERETLNAAFPNNEITHCLSADMFGEGLEQLSQGRISLAGAYLALQAGDVPTTAIHLADVVKAAEKDHNARTFDELRAFDMEQYGLCIEVLNVCTRIDELVRQPDFAITQGVKDALVGIQDVRNSVVPLMDVLRQNMPTISAHAYFSPGIGGIVH